MNKQKMVAINAFLLAALSFSLGSVKSQDLQKNFKVFNRAISEGQDAGSIHLNEANNAGIAWIKGVNATTGVIEVDIKGKDVVQQSFVGIAFHGVNDTTYEAIYFRPFNFRAKDTIRKVHAVQYIASPQYDWPKLRADFPGKYEKAVTPEPDPNGWFHARIMIGTQKISVYVNENTHPSLEIEPLVKLTGTQVGYWVGNSSAGDWKNFKFTPVNP